MLVLYVVGFPLTLLADTAQVVEVGEVLSASVYLNAQQTYTIETDRLSGDPAMAIMHQGEFSELASNDDAITCVSFPTFNCFLVDDARINFTPTTSGYYDILVYSKTQAEGGITDLLLDGVTIRQNAEFGGELVTLNTYGAYTTRIRATARERTWGCNSPIALLKQPADPNCQFFCTQGFVDGDQYSGPNYDAAFTPASGYRSNVNGQTQVLVGIKAFPFPCSQPTNTVLVTATLDDGYMSSYDDPDADGLTTTLENLIGTDPNTLDSDQDGIEDTFEVFGNNGFSYATGGYHDVMGLTPASTRNVYMDLLILQPEPPADPFRYDMPAGLEAELAQTFLDDSDDGIIFEWIDRVYVPSQGNVDIGLSSDACGSISTCVDISDMKTNHIVSYTSKAPYFRFGLVGQWIARKDSTSGTSQLTGLSGLAVFGGQDFLIGWNAINAATSSSAPLDGRLEGTAMHELGHTMHLNHNRNALGNNGLYNEPYSPFHKSVMSYEFQYEGVDYTQNYTFSTGTYDTNGDLDFIPCQTSTKGYCVWLRQQNLCSYDPLCDHDPDEWSAELDLPYYFDNNTDPGISGPAPSSSSQTSSYARNRKRVHDRKDSFPRVDPPRATTQEFPPKSSTERRSAAERLRARLEAQGYMEGSDFEMSADGERIVVP